MSKLYKEDYAVVRKVVYATHGGPNPYEEGSRKHRLYEKAKNNYNMMNDLDTEMQEIYGSYEATLKYPVPLKPEDVDHTLKRKT